jgi:hypothetical protein
LDGLTFLTNSPRELSSAKSPKPILWMVQHLRLDSPMSIARQSIYDMF